MMMLVYLFLGGVFITAEDIKLREASFEEIGGVNACPEQITTTEKAEHFYIS